MAISPDTNSIVQTLAIPSPAIEGLEFGTSADGFPVARIGDILLALLSNGNGAFFLANAWRLTGALAELRRGDFHGHDGRMANEAAFIARAIEMAEHRRELAALSRLETRTSAITPWGHSQRETTYADGIVYHSTAGHGGFRLSSARNVEIDCSIRNEGGWYEEDAEWAIVATAFPNLFTAHERRCADDTIRNTWPDHWEKIHGHTLGPGESWSRDRAEFARLHAQDWVVVSAIHCEHHTGMTEVIATRGGRLEREDGERRFLVPELEYATRGRFGFVVDPDQHAAYDGPSGFIGGSARAV